ncbi:MAG: DDE-type integrase/transposase/recombinase [Flavisolibacter sp.]|nr:DDE-type integrase/transposase/recombinase [Flavisolibacter sp.]
MAILKWIKFIEAELTKNRIRRCKYLNNRVEQDHRFIKWRAQKILDFRSFESASRTL